MTDAKGTAGPMKVDTALVRKLTALLNEGDLSEIEVQDGERKIVVKRKIGAPATPPLAVAAPALAPLSAATVEVPAGDLTFANHPGTIKSPMVGTVYLSSEPGSGPFVSAGDRISEGETLLIVEAMKVMNPITAPRAGTVKQIFVQDAQPVEFDQPLVVIE